jgi:hypothetical protein
MERVIRRDRDGRVAMWEDPIAAEVRKIREDYAAQFNYDLRALCRALQEREQQDPRPKVSLPPRPARLIRVAKSATVLAEGKTPYESKDD